MKSKSHSHLIHNSLFIKATLTLLFLSVILIVQNQPVVSKMNEEKDQPKKITILPTRFISPSPFPSQTISYESVKPRILITPTDTAPWGVSQQVGEHTYKIKVGMDDHIATPSEVVSAINSYRQVQGRNSLSWDGNLALYAQSRADFFTSKGTLDAHSGFNAYLTNEDGFKKLGYYNLGENSSIGYKLAGVHLIEWVFASDAPHNDNQLNPLWTNIGVGVNGTAVDIIFAANRM